MLSGEGMQRRRTVKNNKRSSTCSTLFLHISLPLFCTTTSETSRNFLVTRFTEEMSYLFLFTFFTPAHFHLALVAARISHFVTAVTKKCLLCFLSLALDLCRPFAR